jgi:hypothetical protein
VSYEIIGVEPHERIDGIPVSGEFLLVSVAKPRGACCDLDRSLGVNEHSLDCV